MNQWIMQKQGLPSLLAVDPGNNKTGLALLDAHGELVGRIIIDTTLLEEYIQTSFKAYPSIAVVVCGNGTNHRKLYPLLESLAEAAGKEAHLVNEAYTTEEAKKLYWVFNPPKGLRRLLPKGFLVPPEPVDDITAYVIGKRWFSEKYVR